MIDIKHKDTGAILARVDGKTLRGASLVNAQLSGADLSGADLTNATLSGALLEHAMLDRASLVGACLDRADLRHASLIDANLTDASLLKAKLGRAQLNGCKLRYAKLAGAQLSRSSMIGVDMSMADAQSVELVDANLQTADLRGTNFSDADLRRANLNGADLSGATLAHAITQGAQLANANLQDVIKRAAPTAVAEIDYQPATVRELPMEKPQEFTSVSVKCPECGRPAKIMRENLDNYVSCRDCKERYYVDRAGETHAKKPVQETDWTPEVHGTLASEHTDWEITPERLRLIKLVTVWSVSGLLVLLTGVIGLAWWGDGLPTELVDRATAAGQAFVDGDEDTLAALTAAGMEPHIQRWLNAQRSEEWKKSIDAGNTPRIEATTNFTNLKTRRASVLLQIWLDPTASESPPKSLYARFVLPWMLDENDKWRIDAQTLTAEPD
jgi:uncharacterized protein YjbI with pentapeptide repeats